MSPDIFSTDGSAVGAFGTVDDQAFDEDGSEIVANLLPHRTSQVIRLARMVWICPKIPLACPRACRVRYQPPC